MNDARTRLQRALAITALAAVAACSGGGGAQSVAPLAPANLGTSANPGSSSSSPLSVTRLNGSKAFTSSATLIGPATTISSVVLHVVPNLQNAAGLAQYAQQVNDPTSAVYRHFLAPTDIASRFGASASDYAAVANYFASYGLKVGGWPQRLALTVAGPRPLVEKAIGTSFGFYRSREGHTMLAPEGTVEFSKAIPVHAIARAVVDPQAQWTNAVKGGGAPGQLGYSPQQIAAAFDFDSAYAAGYTGSGVTIGIIGTGPAMSQDFTAYKSQYGVGGSGTLTFPPVLAAAAAANTNSSPLATPPPVTAPCSSSSSPYYTPSESPTASCNPEDGEAQIDTEQAALARDATIAFYLAYTPAECYTAGSASCSPDPTTGLGYDLQGLAESDDEIQEIIADNTADVVSGSYGGPEVLTNADYVANALSGYDPSALLPSEMSALAVEGIAAFFSSGDDGAETCAPYSLNFGGLQCVSEPSSDSNVTAVGGTTTPLNNAGTFVGPLTGWGQQTASGGASGGGVSCYYPTPPWQIQPSYESAAGALLTVASLGTGSSCAMVGATNGGRVLPDISLEGDPYTGVGVVGNVAFGQYTQSAYGGTSVAAPEMAAMWAVVLSACAKTPSCATATGAKPYRLGNAAPLLWKIYQNQATYGATIYDVTFGSNGTVPCEFQGGCSAPATPAPGFNASVGWDAVTGLGVPFTRHLIQAIVGV